MKVLACRGSVDARLVKLGRIVPKVFHVAKDVTLAVLGDKVPKVGSKPHISDSALVVAPGLNRKTFEQYEAAPVEDFVADGPKSALQDQKRELVLCHR